MDAFDQVFGEAIWRSEPKIATPRRKKPGAASTLPKPDVASPPLGEITEPLTRHTESETQRMSAREAEGAAEDESSPTCRPSPPHIELTRQPATETQWANARDTGEATAPAKPIQPSPRRTNSKIARQSHSETQSRTARKPRRSNTIQKPIDKAVAGANELTRQNESEHHNSPARDVGGGGQFANETQGDVAPAADHLINKIRYAWRMRQRWHRAEKSLILQGKAICRAYCGGDKDEANAAFDAAYEGNPPSIEIFTALVPFLSSIEQFRVQRTPIEKSLGKLAKQLPIWPWVKPIKGFGEQSLASIVGEAGDIGSYRTVSGLWKRMGLAVIDGERQRKCSNADKAILHGYSPARRAVMWNVGGAVIGGMGHGPRPFVGEDISGRGDWTEYQKLFIERCRIEAGKIDEEGKDDSREPVVNKKTGELKESYSKRAAARAKRFVEKRLLRELFLAWRSVSLEDVELRGGLSNIETQVNGAAAPAPRKVRQAAMQLTKPIERQPPVVPTEFTHRRRLGTQDHTVRDVQRAAKDNTQPTWTAPSAVPTE